MSDEDYTDMYGEPGYTVITTPKTKPVYKIHIGDTLTDAARYRWLRDNVFEVNCEGRPADCVAKWMLPRLVAEDITGKKFTFDEIIEIQMKRDQPNE